MLAIGTDGRLFPCIRFMKYSLSNKDREEFELGNVEKGIESFEDNKYRQALSNITRKSQSTDKCFNCELASGCAWCTAHNYDCFGTPNKRATFICEMHKARVLACHYFFNKLYNKEHINKEFKLNISEEDIKRIKGELTWKE